MKITILTRLMAALALLTAAPLTAQAAFNQILYTANYTGTPVLGTDTLGGVTYATVGYGDLYNDGQPGMPYLPVDYLRFSVPYNATNFTVAATCPVMYKTTRNLSHLVYPSQPPRLMNDTTPVIITLPDSTAYSAGGSYPMQQAWVVDEGFLDGENHIVTVAVMPFVYKRTSTSDKLEQWKRVNVRLQYDLSDSLAMYPIVRNDSTMREEGYNLARSIVVNPGQVKTFAPVDISNDFDSLGINLYGTTGDGLNGGIFPGFDPQDPTPIDTTDLGSQEMHEALYNYTYLIVTTDEYVHSLRRLAALKRQKGYNVKIVTMDQVLSNPIAQSGDRFKQADGTYKIAYADNAGALREYLKYCYCIFQTRFVLLVGNNVPYRYKSYDYLDVPSDLYFSDLNADWSEDKIDRVAELYVGRLLADDFEQIDNYTDKLFRYELNPGHGNSSYLKRALFTEGHDMHIKHEVRNLRRYSDNIFSYSCEMTEDTSGVKFPSGVDIVNEINEQGYGYLSFHNHAYPSGLLTYGHRSDRTCKDDSVYYFLWAIDTVRTFYNGKQYKHDLPEGNGLNCLTNKYRPSVCYSIACTTMPYDTIQNFENDRLNFGQSFTVGRNYGGVAFLGNTRKGFIDYSSRLENSFIQQLTKGRYKLGQAEAFSKVGFADDRAIVRIDNKDVTYLYYYSCVHNLLGDPDIELWTDIPLRFSNVVLTRTNHSMTVSGIEEDSTIVVYFNNARALSRIISTSSSVTFDNVSPNGTVMLYKHNCLPYIAPICLQNVSLSNSEYVIASDFTAGKAIDNSLSTGDVVINSGINYEIESSGTVTLQDGFKVEKGAIFAVYPSCF